MAEAIKVLGQVTPLATTLTTLYTVPALTTSVVSTLTVCNQAAIATTFRVSVAVAGAADATKQYIAYDVAISGNETKTFTLGMTLGAADVVRAYAGTATVSFNAFGSETS